MASIPEMIVDYVQCVHPALDQAEKILNEKQASDTKLAELIPLAVEALVKHERIDPADRVKAASLLTDPVQLLQILIKTADVNNTIRPKQLGQAVKQASSQRNDNYVGRRSADNKPSDEFWEAQLLGAS